MKVIKLLKRWLDMLFGKSVFHVKQGVGKYYSKEKISGYYNDMTGKVCENTVLDDNGIPLTSTIAGVTTYFPIAIFQYGLGLYDLYIGTNKKAYEDKFLKIANWAMDNIDKNGMWDCMKKLNDSVHETQSSMCQSEGVSVLLRAYTLTNDTAYLKAAKQAIAFMVKNIKNGGTSYIDSENSIIFQEYVSKDNLCVLNGWIFSIFGLYDYCHICKEKKYTDILNNTVQTLIKKLPAYDRGYWTNYDLKGTIASPAYHDIHIMQLKLLYDLFGNEEFNIYAEKWEIYQKSKIKKYISMLIKVKQKIFRNGLYDINTSTVEVKKNEKN